MASLNADQKPMKELKKCKVLPVLTSPDSSQLFLLGERQRWPQLEEVLTKLDKRGDEDEFVVETPREEASVDVIRRMFQQSTNCHSSNILHVMLGGRNSRAENPGLLQMLLSWGVRPDLEDGLGMTPAHYCAEHARPQSATAIAACRPDMEARNKNSEIAVTVAFKTKEGKPDDAVAVLEAFEALQINGPQSVAELARDEKWFAVKNLIRRKCIKEEEMFQQADGKDAIGWANHHKKHGLASELDYYFNRKKKIHLVGQVMTLLETNASILSTSNSFSLTLARLGRIRARAAMGTFVPSANDQLEERLQDVEKTLELVLEALRVSLCEVKVLHGTQETLTAEKERLAKMAEAEKELQAKEIEKLRAENKELFEKLERKKKRGLGGFLRGTFPKIL